MRTALLTATALVALSSPAVARTQMGIAEAASVGGLFHWESMSRIVFARMPHARG